jgi:hypothetical protein
VTELTNLKPSYGCYTLLAQIDQAIRVLVLLFESNRLY